MPNEDLKLAFWSSLKDSPYIMMNLMGSKEHALPMTAQADDKVGFHPGGSMWFFTATDNRLMPGGPAMGHFSGKGHDLFACISGTLVPESDETIIDHFWSNPVAAWYEGGRDDPKLAVLRFDLDEIEMWKPEFGVKGAFKLMTGMTIKPGEAGPHAVVEV